MGSVTTRYNYKFVNFTSLGNLEEVANELGEEGYSLYEFDLDERVAIFERVSEGGEFDSFESCEGE